MFICTYGNPQLIEICILQVFNEFLIHDFLCPGNVQDIVVFFLNPRFEIIEIQLKLFRKLLLSDKNRRLAFILSKLPVNRLLFCNSQN